MNGSSHTEDRGDARTALGRAGVLALLVLCAACGGESQEPAARTDVAAVPQDEWASEVLAARADSRLKLLGKHIAAGDAEPLDGLVAEGVLWPDLRPEGARALEAAPYSVLRWDADAFGAADRPPRAACAALLEPLADGAELGTKFKVVGISDIDAEGFTTRVLAHVDGRLGAGALQIDAEWVVRWRHGAQPEEPLLAELTPERMDLVRVARVPFVERTAGVFAHAPEAAALLAHGGDAWRRRIDSVGEANAFGHNGIAVGDADGDGREDLYVANGTGLPNMLLLRQPDGSVREAAHAAGLAWLDDTKGALFVDLDRDGDQDLVLAIANTLALCLNDGQGAFTPAAQLQAPGSAAFYSVAAADYDLDGDLDLYGVRYVHTEYGDTVPVPYHDARNGPTNHLLRNDGGMRWSDVTGDVGLDVGNDRFSLAAAWADADDDGDPDLYVANDFGRNNIYRNDAGRFVEVSAAAGVEDQAAGMGVSWADADGDGRLDLYVSNMFSAAGHRVAYQDHFQADASAELRSAVQRHALGNSLFLADGERRFRDASDAARVRMGRWSWGGIFSDLNADGRPDMVVPNGFLTNDKTEDL